MPHVELRKVADGRRVCYAPHSHTQWSIGAIVKGQSTFQYRSQHYRTHAGDIVLMNPGWVHACNPIDNQPWAYLMLYVDIHWLTDFLHGANLLREPRWQDISTATISEPYWYERYCRMANCLLSPQRDLLDKQTEVVEFLSELMPRLVKQPPIQAPGEPQTLKMLAHYLDDHAAENLSLDKLCKISGYSAGHLVRAFREYSGLTPHAYLVNRRVQLGRLDLANGMPIADAALNAGFADQSHFQRTFKRLMSATPKQYRCPSPHHEIQATDGEQ